MIKINLNNERVFNKSIVEVLEEDPELLGLDNNTINDLRDKVNSNEKIKIVNDNERAPKENYDIYNDKIYLGNIMLFNENITDYWEIDILIFPEYRRKGFARSALQNLIDLYPDRNWEANILDKNINLKALEIILFDLSFEKTDNGILGAKGEGIIYNYQKTH